MKTLLNARLVTGILALAVLASFLAVGQPILADDGEAPDVPRPGVVMVTDTEEALRLDAQAIADEENVTVEAALGVLHQQQRGAEVAKAVSAQYPDRFAGMVLEGGFSNPHSVLMSKGAVPPGLAALVDQLDSNVAIVGGQRFSLGEMQKRVAAMGSVMRAEGFDRIRAAVNTRANRIDVWIETSDGFPQSLSGAVGQGLQRELGSALGEIRDGDIAFTVVEDATVIQQDMYGGDKRWQSIAHGNFCSSAFTVQNASGVAGVLSAAHCDAQNQYVHEWGTTEWTDHVGSYYGYNGDFEWRKLRYGGTVNDDFYSSNGVIRDVTGIQYVTSMAVNDWVCVFGRASQQMKCRQIVDTYDCFWLLDPLTWSCGWVKTSPVNTIGGDSGAPWFGGTTAYGIHHGIDVEDGSGYFSPVELAQTYLGVTVKY